MSEGRLDASSVHAPAAFRRALLGFLVADLALLGAWTALTVHLLDGFGSVLAPIALGAPLAVAFWIHAPVRRTVIGAIRLDARASIAAALVFAVASFVVVAARVPDALIASAPHATAVARTGAVDAVITAPDAATRDAIGASIAANGTAPFGQEESEPLGLLVDGVLEARRAVASVGTLDRPVRVAVVELDLQQAARFGGDPGASGLRRDVTLPADGMLLGPDVAQAIGARVGDRVMVDVGGTSGSLLVSGILPAHGFGTLDPRRRVADPVTGPVLVAPGALASLGTDGAPILLVSAEGDAETGKAFSATVVQALRRLPTTQVTGVSVSDPSSSVRRSTHRTFDAARHDLRRLGLAASLAALLACVVAAVGLARRRRATVLVLRDLGMARGDVVSALSVECWLAALVGVTAGAGLGGVAAHRAVDAAIRAGGAVTADVQRSIVRSASVVFVIAALTGMVSIARSTGRRDPRGADVAEHAEIRRRGRVAVLLTWMSRNAGVLVPVIAIGAPLVAARARVLDVVAPLTAAHDLAVPFALAALLALGSMLVLWAPLRATADALRITGRRVRPFASVLSFAVGAAAVAAALLGTSAAVVLGQLVQHRG